MSHSVKAVAYLLLVLPLMLGSCSSTTGPSSPEMEVPTIPTRTLGGTVALPVGSVTDVSTLDVVSFAQRAPVSADGTFSVLIPDIDSPQALVVMGEGSSPVLLGYIEPGQDSVIVDASTTALALVMMNPFMVMFSASDQATVAQMVRDKDWWPELVELTEEVVRGSRAGRLDETLEPTLMQLAADIAIDVLDDYPSGGLSAGDPWIEDADGDDISFVNPDVVYHAACISSEGGMSSSVVLVDSDRSNIKVMPGWPPFVDMLSMTHTTVNLGDGTFNVALTHGDLADFDASTANGLAGSYNVSRAIVEALALAAGTVVEPGSLGLDFPSMAGTHGLTTSLRGGDTYAFFSQLLGFVGANAASVARAFWGRGNADAQYYIETVCPLLDGILFSTQVLADGEDRIPFFSRFVTKEPVGSQRIAQLDGVMVVAGSREPPEADFELSTPFGSPGETITVDAGVSSDPDDPAGSLKVRWDWENDGVWDTEWTSEKTAEVTYDEAGAYEIVLQVRDPELLNDVAVHRLNIGGGGSSATHIVVFRDAVPWDSEIPPVLDQMLEVMEFTQGTGPDEYEIVGSAAMDTFDLTPGEDLVIIQSDQPQTFYDAYAANEVRFLQFVSAGGTIFWEACDEGSHGGSIESAGIDLPAAVHLEPYLTWYNYVALPGAPVVEGLPYLLYGQYASHSGVTGLPDGATVYVTDDAGHPTLVEYSYGGGWVIMATQPLEWDFYNNWTAGSLMPHVVGYVVGRPLVYDFGDIVKPEERGRPMRSDGAGELTSGTH